MVTGQRICSFLSGQKDSRRMTLRISGTAVALRRSEREAFEGEPQGLRPAAPREARLAFEFRSLAVAQATWAVHLVWAPKPHQANQKKQTSRGEPPTNKRPQVGGKTGDEPFDWAPKERKKVAVAQEAGSPKWVAVGSGK